MLLIQASGGSRNNEPCTSTACSHIQQNPLFDDYLFTMFRKIIERLKLPFRKDRELRSALFRILGFYPQNIEYYKIAFAHKSQAFRDKKGQLLNNERLEFLGDAVLESVVSDILFHHFEKKHEGFLTSTRSKIVQRESLNKLAKDLGIDQLVQTSTRSNTHHSHIGGNAFEALMGAVYLDKGYKTCQRFIRKQILGRLMDLDGVANKEVNFKSKLLEWCQKNKILNEFQMYVEDGDKQKEAVFHCTVVIEGIDFGYGKGYSKKEAQQLAAKETLTILRKNETTVDSIFRAKEKRTAMEANEVAVVPKIDEIEQTIQQELENIQTLKPTTAKPKDAKPETPRKKKSEPKKAQAEVKTHETQRTPKTEVEPSEETVVTATIEPEATEVATEAESNKAKDPKAPTPQAPNTFPIAIAEAAIAEAEGRTLPMVIESQPALAVPATQQPEKAKKTRRRSHPKKVVAEFTATVVPTEEEQALSKQEKAIAKAEKEQERRAKKAAQKAKKVMQEAEDKLTEKQPDNTEKPAEAPKESTPAADNAKGETKAHRKTKAEKFRERRQRQAEAKRMAQESNENATAPEATEDATATPTDKPQPKKRQSGNSRTRRRQQAMAQNDDTNTAE